MDFRSSCVLIGVFLVLSTVMFSGCGEALVQPSEEEGEVADEAQKNYERRSSAIANGDSLDAEQEALVDVRGCSGTLLRNDWVLTARHCVVTYYDRPFGTYNNGKDYTRFTSTEDSWGYDVALWEEPSSPADHRIAAVGFAKENGRVKVAVSLYDFDGELVQSFGSGGKVLLQDFHPYEAEVRAYDAEFDANGKIVLAGYMKTTSGNYYVIAARLNQDGTLDQSFASGGKWTMSGSNKIVSNSLKIAPNNDILIGGYFVDYYGEYKMYVKRLQDDGSNQNNFGTYGFASVDVASGGEERLKGMDIDEFDGSIVLTGWANPGGNTRFAAAKLKSDGQLANGTGYGEWGSNATQLINFASSSTEKAFGVTIDQSRGDAYLVGQAYRTTTSEWDSGIAKLKWSDGSLDSNFGSYNNGKEYLDHWKPSKARTAVYDETNQKLTVAGEFCDEMSGDPDDMNCRFGVARLHRDGEYDVTFHQDGHLGVQFKGSETESARGIALDKEERIVLVGQSHRKSSNRKDFAIARLLPYHDEVPLYGYETYDLGSQSRDAETAFMHPSYDVLLVKMEQPFEMNGSTSGYSRDIYAQSSASLDGKNLFCMGYGGASNGSSAYLTASDRSDQFIDTPRNDQGQQICGGDSGGPCFYEWWDCSNLYCQLRNEVAGVIKSGPKNCSDPSTSQGKIVGADEFYDWANDIIANN